MNPDQARTIIDIYYNIFPDADNGLRHYFTMSDDDTIRAGCIAAEGIARGRPWSSRWVKRKLGPTWGDTLPSGIVI